MAENIQEKLQKAGSEMDHASKHIRSIKEMGEGQESFLDLFEALKITVGKLLEHSSDAYDHIAQAHKHGQQADQALREAGFPAEADQASSEAKLKVMVALRPAIEGIATAGAFTSDRAATYNETLSKTTRAMSIVQMRAADCDLNVLEARELIDRYPLA